MKKTKTNQIAGVMPLDQKSMVREANELIEAKYILDTWEARIFHAAISQIKPNDNDFQKYKIYIKDIAERYDIKDKDMYRRIREAAKTLRGKEIVIPYRYEEGMGHLVTGLITSYGGLDKSDGAFVMIELHPDLKPYLLLLKKRFTQYNLLFLMKMQSRYSRRIYKLLKQYQTIGKRKFSIGRLRELLCIEENVYAKYSHFKKRVILKAQEDLEELTDIRFTFDEHKRGRSVAELTFYIIRNKPTQIALEEAATPISEEATLVENEPAIRGLSDKLWEEVRNWGISKQNMAVWVAEFGEAQVQRAVHYTQNAIEKGEVSNPGGYLNKMVREANFSDATALKKQQQQKKREQAAAIARQKAAAEAQERSARRAHYEAKMALVRKILLENPMIQTQVFSQIKASNPNSFDEGKTDMENYAADGAVIRPKVNQLVFGQFPELFAPIDEQLKLTLAQLAR